MIVAGIDPGLSGALAIINTERRTLDVFDIPTVEEIIAGKKRRRLDESRLLILFQLQFSVHGCKRAVIEGVQGYKDQSASASFQFGYVVGMIKMSAMATGARVETANAAVWKLQMQVPVDKEGILACVQRHFPGRDHLWRGPRGGILDGRCEAALLAKYGAERIFR